MAVGRQHHQSSRVRMQANRVTLIEGPPDDGCGVLGQMTIDDKECCHGSLSMQNIEEIRCRGRIRTVIERKIDGRPLSTRRHPPDCPGGRNGIDQERERRDMRQRKQTQTCRYEEEEHRQTSAVAKRMTPGTRSSMTGAVRLAALVSIALLVAGATGPVAAPQDHPADRSDERRRMVEQQIESREIRDPRVLDAMRLVPRHRFVPDQLQDEAYSDTPLPIGLDQTISQPYIVAYMTEALQLAPTATVLEIGTGSGYQAAVLSEIARQVYSVEIVPALAERSQRILTELGYENIQLRQGDGYRGWPEAAPFDGIIVTAAPDHVPPALVDQLAVGGRLVIPVGASAQQMRVITRTEDGPTSETTIPVRFVPMTGEARER